MKRYKIIRYHSDEKDHILDMLEAINLAIIEFDSQSKSTIITPIDEVGLPIVKDRLVIKHEN